MTKKQKIQRRNRERNFDKENIQVTNESREDFYSLSTSEQAIKVEDTSISELKKDVQRHSLSNFSSESLNENEHIPIKKRRSIAYHRFESDKEGFSQGFQNTDFKDIKNGIDIDEEQFRENTEEQERFSSEKNNNLSTRKKVNQKRYAQHTKDKSVGEILNKSQSRSKYFKSNFDDIDITRSKNHEKNISKLQQKKQRQIRKSKSKKRAIPSKGAIFASESAKSYLESGKEDNAGVSAAHKVFRTSEKILRKGQNKKKNIHRRVSKLDRTIKRKEDKFYFKNNIRELKKTSEYQNTSKLRNFFKRKQYKKKVQNKFKDSVKEKIKKFLIESQKIFADYVRSKGRTIIFLMLMAVGIFFMLFNMGSMVMNLGTSMVSDTVGTTYLSSEDTLKDINQEFSSLEQSLQEEMDSVESNHPGYDEYIVTDKEKIGHDVHELLSYVTARYGVVKDVSEIEEDLKNLFDSMYSLSYKEEVEIRYRTTTDSDGNEYSEAYEYKKLIVNLEKREMDNIIREVFAAYPNNQSHYEVLLASKGNMEKVFGSSDFSEIINNPNFSNPGIEFNDVAVKQIVNEAERHLGKRYVFGANGPNNFDCSSFVCWSYTHSGIKNMPRTTAWRIYTDYCNPVSPSEAKAGDIIFFKNTYNSGEPISHVGIYVGGGYMIHAGDPIQYARIDTPYWASHFYGFGRPR